MERFGAGISEVRETKIMFHDGIALGNARYSNSRPVKRTVDFHGLPISVEFDIGETKRGIGDYGEIWVHKFYVPYGEIPSSQSLADGDGVDVYLGTNPQAPFVYVVHQLRRDGTPDEDKCMLCFDSAEEAIQAYKDHGPSWGYGSCDVMTVDQFLFGYLGSNRKPGYIAKVLDTQNTKSRA